MCRDMVDASTPEEIIRAINDVNSDQEAIAAAQPEDVDAGELSQLHTAWRKWRRANSD